VKERYVFFINGVVLGTMKLNKIDGWLKQFIFCFALLSLIWLMASLAIPVIEADASALMQTPYN
jgi:hypothetical protein